MSIINILSLAVAVSLSCGSAHAQRPQIEATDARKAVDNFDEAAKALAVKHSAAIQKLTDAYDVEIVKIRQLMLTKLKAALETETKAGDLDQAIEVRDAIIFYDKFDPRKKQDKRGKSNTRRENAKLQKRVRELEKSLAAAKKESFQIPAVAVLWEGHHYLRIDKAATKRIAMKYAESIGGHLARVESNDERAFLFNLVRSGERRWYILDGSDEQLEGTWVWSSDKPVTYLDWDAREPTGRSFQHDLLMNPRNGKMHDGICGERNGFVIEWER